jgi:hypothetical protein
MLFRPVGFRIRDYKSIGDSGMCSFSGDGITVLAGQNEAGKTSVLQALFDFNGEPGSPPGRADIIPDDRTTATPTVAMEFKFNTSSVLNSLQTKGFTVAPPLQEGLESGSCLIERNLLTGDFRVQGTLGEIFETIAQIKVEQTDSNNSSAEVDLEAEDEDSSSKEELADLDADSFCEFAYQNWPMFDYFDSFDDLLPRKVPIDTIQKVVGTLTKTVEPTIPDTVRDFLYLAKIDLAEIRRLADLNDDEKQLKNHLAAKSASITGDFLGYWKQRTGGMQAVKLKTEFSRRNDGAYLVFYVEDGSSLQFADQRSRGLLWFLSFYIRLAAAVERGRTSHKRFILIDEPGSFLHPKAQQDILDVLQRRIIQEGDLVVYSTHSPYLLPPDLLHRIRLIFKGDDGKTVIADRLTDPRIKGDIQGNALAPVMASIGMTVEAHLSEVHNEVFVVEGITDYYYLYAWAKLLGSTLLAKRAIIVATGTPNVPYSVSLALAFSKSFAVLLDRDSAGNAAAEKLRSKMDISSKVIIQPKDILAIEDLLHHEDFIALVKQLDPAIKVEAGSTPTTSIKKLSIEKVLLARKFAELVSQLIITKESLRKESVEQAKALFLALEVAITEDPVFRVQ